MYTADEANHSMPKNCPKCQTAMKPQTVDGVVLDICPECAGIWFDGGELRALLSNSPDALQDVENIVPKPRQTKGELSRMLCPIDLVRLDLYHYLYSSSALLHTCSKCRGFFVEAEELPKMEQARVQAHEPGNPVAEAESAVEGAHEYEMQRESQIKGLFDTLRKFSPGWFF